MIGGMIIASILSGFMTTPFVWVAPAIGMLIGRTISNLMDDDDDDASS